MHYSILRNLLHGVYMIDPNMIWEYQFMLNSLRNGLQFEPEEEFQNTIPYNVSNQQFSTSNSSNENPTEISVHSVRDIMLRDDMGCGHVGTRTIGKRLLKSDSDPKVFAHIIIFDSPGGASNSVAELSDAIQACEKPVYAWVDGYCCSAAIYAASYCTEIHAHRSSDVVGSVGTMVQFRGVKSGEKDANGVYEYRIYASKSTKKNKVYEEAINNGNVELVKEWLNKLNERFIGDMKNNLPGTKEDIHLTGDTWEASEVIGVFIDSVKNFNELVQHIVDQFEESNSETQQQSNSISNSNKSKTSMNLAALVALLAVSGIEIQDGGAHLTEDQLEKINAELETISGLKDQLQAAQDAQATAESNLQAANDTIAQRDETITAHEATIADLKDEPGTPGAQANTSGDDKPQDGKVETVAKGEDFGEDLANVASAYLGEEI